VVDGILYVERNWVEEFCFNTVFNDHQLTDEAGDNEISNHLSGHIWLSPQLHACHTGRNTDHQFDNRRVLNNAMLTASQKSNCSTNCSQYRW